MASSRADTLTAVSEAYDRALEAVLTDDLDKLGSLLDEVDALLLDAGNPVEDSPEEQSQRELAHEGFRLLLSALHESQANLKAQLGATRSGQRAVQGYQKAHGRGQGRRLSYDV